MKYLFREMLCAAVCSLSIPLFAAGPGQAAALSVIGAEKVVEAEDHDIRHYTGQVVSRSVVSIVPRVSGEILEVGFKDGGVVRKGQMLYKLDPVQYEAAVKGAEASIEKCKAELTYAQSNYNRLNLLYERQATSLGTLESAKATLGAAKAALLSAEAELITAKDNLKNTVITAPRRGSSASPPIRRATTSRPIPAHCSPSSRPSRYGSASPSASPTFSACSAPTGN